MNEAKPGTTKRITIEEGRIIIESNDKAWLEFIKNEVLTTERAPKSQDELVKKFVQRCWRRLPMRNVIKTLAHSKQTTFEDISEKYKAEFKKARTTSGVMSGLTRNAKRTGLPKHWLNIEHTGSHWNYSISEAFFPIVQAEVFRLEAETK